MDVHPKAQNFLWISKFTGQAGLLAASGIETKRGSTSEKLQSNCKASFFEFGPIARRP
jgi:hypothetical protein